LYRSHCTTSGVERSERRSRIENDESRDVESRRARVERVEVEVAAQPRVREHVVGTHPAGLGTPPEEAHVLQRQQFVVHVPGA
jgi:hypothetical protein